MSTRFHYACTAGERAATASEAKMSKDLTALFDKGAQPTQKQIDDVKAQRVAQPTVKDQNNKDVFRQRAYQDEEGSGKAPASPVDTFDWDGVSPFVVAPDGFDHQQAVVIPLLGWAQQTKPQWDAAQAGKVVTDPPKVGK